MMEEMFRWMLIGFIAGLWLSLEECESGTGQNSNMGGRNIPLICCKTHSSKTCFMPCLSNETRPVHITFKQSCEVHGWKCVNPEDAERSLSYCADISDTGTPKLPDSNISEPTEEKGSGVAIIQKNTVSPQEDNQCITLHCKITNIGGLADCDGKSLKWNCNHKCCIVCHKDSPATNTTTTTTTPRETAATTATSGKTTTTTATPRTMTTTAKNPAVTPNIQSHATNHSRIAEESNSSYTNTILLVLLLCVAIVIIIAAVVLFMRKRKFSRRGEVSMTRTDENEAVSSGYETTVRENHYELSGEGAPIYTELELAQETAPSNSTVYASVQPTGEAIDMGKRVVYAELDKVAVAVSPIYSQPFGSETSAINADYAEPFKPDTKSTATAPVSNLYCNIAAVDELNAYSLAEAIPLSDPNVIYSQPNKPRK